LPSGSCLWLKLKDTWRMYWPTNKLSLSDAFAEVLGGQLRPKTDTPMDKDAGLSNQLNSSWIC